MLMHRNRLHFALIQIATTDKIVDCQHDRLLSCVLIKASTNIRNGLVIGMGGRWFQLQITNNLKPYVNNLRLSEKKSSVRYNSAVNPMLNRCV
ncbi:hypothetical protein ICHIJ1_05050 [Fluviibacter phosphoraccumulans]|uniref:Uncharacterized protein n=1 Tax=Fluviibacter phosphoraccumulans TaxID=1751046 RepID=A0A7R6QZ68_9RHOO|nr:hypothetical protein ICHIAU1_01580 [Fluviibacter phosphoraccumulans]BBU70586.1 hypothetical protein ICHIJ1_05050 [Fluviibacter phosphoraccumulans]